MLFKERDQSAGELSFLFYSAVSGDRQRLKKANSKKQFWKKMAKLKNKNNGPSFSM